MKPDLRTSTKFCVRRPLALTLLALALVPATTWARDYPPPPGAYRPLTQTRGTNAGVENPQRGAATQLRDGLQQQWQNPASYPSAPATPGYPQEYPATYPQFMPDYQAPGYPQGYADAYPYYGGTPYTGYPASGTAPYPTQQWGSPYQSGYGYPGYGAQPDYSAQPGYGYQAGYPEQGYGYSPDGGYPAASRDYSDYSGYAAPAYSDPGSYSEYPYSEAPAPSYGMPSYPPDAAGSTYPQQPAPSGRDNWGERLPMPGEGDGFRTADPQFLPRSR